MIDRAGFPVEFKNWTRAPEKEGSFIVTSYPQFMFEIKGTNWYERWELEEGYEKTEKKVTPAANYFGVVGLFNSLYMGYYTYAYLWDYSTTDEFWFAWLIAVSTNTLLWVPIFLVWPALNYGGDDIVGFFVFLTDLTLIGAYGAYWINIAALYYVMFISPETSGSDRRGILIDESYRYVGGYTVMSIVSSIVTILYNEEMHLYYEELTGESVLEQPEETEEATTISADGEDFTFE